HVHGRADAELPRGPGDSLSVVARARRDHAGPLLRVVERGELVDGAAHLEGPGALQVLRLQPDVPARAPRERLAPIYGSDRRVPGDPPARFLDVTECRPVQSETPARGSHARRSADRVSALRRR